MSEIDAAVEMEGIYVASRASIPERPAMWRSEGETDDFGELWQRITNEIRRSAGVVLYVEQEDIPLKGAYIECGIAIGMGKPVAVVAHAMPLEERSLRPIGSWMAHPLVSICVDLSTARHSVIQRSAILARAKGAASE